MGEASQMRSQTQIVQGRSRAVDVTFTKAW